MLYEFMVVSGGGKGASALGGIEKGAAFGGVKKYGIVKFGHFWQIAICIADSDIFRPQYPLTLPGFGTTPQLLVLHDSIESSVYTKKLTLLT